MVKNMKDHTVIQKGRAPTAPKRKAHTAIRSGEPGWYLDGGAHTAIRMGEPTPGVVAPANPKRESSHCIQMKKEPCGAS